MKRLRNSPDICRRARLVLAVSAIAGMLLLTLHFQPPTADPLPEVVPHEPAGVPIVAIRGETLSAEEEPLPPSALVRFGSTRFRHPVELFPSDKVAGRYLVTTGDRRFTLTDTITGRRVLTQEARFGTSSHSFLEASVSHDGSRLAVFDRYTDENEALVASVWTVHSDLSRPLQLLSNIRLPRGAHGHSISEAIFSEDNRELYLYGYRGLSLHDPDSGQLLRHISTMTAVLDVAPLAKRYLTSSDTNPRIGFGYGGGIISIPRHRFRAPTLKEKEPESGRVPRRRIAEEGQREMLDLIVSDIANGQTIARVTVPRSAGECVGHLSLSPDGKYLSAGVEKGVVFWNVDRQQQVVEVKLTHQDEQEKRRIWWASFTPDGKRCFVMTSDDRTRYYDLKTGRLVETSAQKPVTRRSSFREVSIDDNGVMQPSKGALPAGYARLVMDCSPDGNLIAAADATGRLDVWHKDGRLAANLLAGGPRVFAVAFSPDGSLLAASDKGRNVHLWSVSGWGTLDRVTVPADHEDLYPEQLTFTPDSRHVLLSKGDIMALWDIGARRMVWDREGALGWSDTRLTLAFSPDCRHLVFASGNDTSVWLDPRTGNEQRQLRLPNPSRPEARSSLTALAFSPDGRTLATAHDHRHIVLRDATSGAVVGDFPRSAAIEARSGLHFSRDGRRLAAGDGGDRAEGGHRAHVWEVATGDLAFTLEYPDGAIHDLRFGSDSRTLVTANHREAIIWSLKPRNSTLPASGTEALWEQLGSREAARADEARWLFLDNPETAIEFLRSRVFPSAAVEERAVQESIRSLDAPRFRERTRAAAELRGLGRRALPYLRTAEKVDSLEWRRRVESLERELSDGPTEEERRHIRAVELLEQIGTSAAQTLIRTWAGGAAGSVLTEEARRSR